MKKITLTLAAYLISLGTASANMAPSLKNGIQYFKRQEHKKAASELYKVLYSPNLSEHERSLARFYLGGSLVKLKLYQTAAFPLIVVAKGTPSKMTQRAFENLVLISENLNDSELLNYTLKKLDAADLNEIAKSFYYTRMGQALMQEQKYGESLEYLKQSLQNDPNGEEALYTTALVYLKQNDTASAIPLLEKIYSKYFNRPATDVKRGRAGLALGRAYYQAKRWNDAVNIYREVPKDHPLYRESQMELAWSLFRTAKFRSAMSTIQTLHTPFYANFYDPESLILRSIILIFVCQNDEAEKALVSFRKNYTSAFSVLADVNRSNQNTEFFFKQIEESNRYLKDLKNNRTPSYKGQLPFFIVRSLIESPALKNKLSYLDQVQEEKNRVAKIFNKADDAPIKKYALKILDGRQKNISKEAGNILKNALLLKEQELSLFTGDTGLINYEILNGKKKEARKEYIRKLNNPESAAIDKNDSRDFYINNGYRYWPFEGEYWRDEIGNYQYLGVNRCDEE
ncbi:tetratricopeptide repeat protein [Bdellovibrio sp. HCB-110]|uniref:tetratricopeptide repeat protein n=1 Tax=Bdellovibrio sp. HCB-110 TaxID=3391182 RepID=UPI0039B418D1